ncbi:hypothetical protein, partial [Klebsiella pneumoniae]|uniref:hypothetical protein n=1 Tax=Klebsiella pneumoniae TaxID=573 RepID=UPI001955479E
RDDWWVHQAIPGRASVPVRGANFLFSCFLANPYLMLIQQVSVKTLPGAFLILPYASGKIGGQIWGQVSSIM